MKTRSLGSLLALGLLPLLSCGNFTPGPLEDADDPIGTRPSTGSGPGSEDTIVVRRTRGPQRFEFQGSNLEGGSLPELTALGTSLERRCVAWAEGRAKVPSVHLTPEGRVFVHVPEGVPKILVPSLPKFLTRRGLLEVALEIPRNASTEEAWRESLISLRQNALRKPGIQAWKAGQRLFPASGEGAWTWVLPPGARPQANLDRALFNARPIESDVRYALVGVPASATIEEVSDSKRTLVLGAGDLTWSGGTEPIEGVERGWLFLDGALLGSFALEGGVPRPGSPAGPMRVDLAPGTVTNEFGIRLLRAGSIPAQLEFIEPER